MELFLKFIFAAANSLLYIGLGGYMIGRAIENFKEHHYGLCGFETMLALGEALLLIKLIFVQL